MPAPRSLLSEASSQSTSNPLAMAPWTVDFVVRGPPSNDLGIPWFAAWQLMQGLGLRGHRVRGIFPSRSQEEITAPSHVEVVPFPDLVEENGSVEAERNLVRAAGEQIAPTTDLVVRWPLGMSSLPLSAGRRAAGPRVCGVVESVGLAEWDTSSAKDPPGGLRDRLGRWRNRRAIKHAESEALHQASVIFARSDIEREMLHHYFGTPKERVESLPPGIPDPPADLDRTQARRALQLPLDDPVVAFAARPDRFLEDGGDLALEAFRRIRVFFPGAKFLAIGAAPPKSESGVKAALSAELPNLSKAFAAADVTIFPSRTGGLHPFAPFAMRFGRAVIVSHTLALPGSPPKGVARVVLTDDVGDYASELADLLADPAGQRAMGQRAKTYADALSFQEAGAQWERSFASVLPR